MRIRDDRAQEEPEINLVPLIDVILVLIIFFVITTTFDARSVLKLELPRDFAVCAAAEKAFRQTGFSFPTSSFRLIVSVPPRGAIILPLKYLEYACSSVRKVAGFPQGHSSPEIFAWRLFWRCRW